jgi:hypothetical protein
MFVNGETTFILLVKSLLGQMTVAGTNPSYTQNEN